MKAFMRIVRKHGHWLFFTLVALLTVYMDVYVASHILDGDVSEYLNRGWHMAQAKNPFMRDYHFTTELRPLDVSALFSVFFQFISDWTLVRILGIVVMQAYYVFSFLYLCRQAGIQKPSAVYAAGFLLLPFSTAYARIVLYHTYYILYLANVFWLLGLTLRLMHTDGYPKWRNGLAALLLGGLWLFVGLNGIRHMMLLGIPLMAFVMLQLFSTLNRYRWEDGGLTGDGLFQREPVFRLTGILIASCLCFLVGFVLNKAVLLPYFRIYDASKTSFSPHWGPDRYTSIFNGWLVASGVRVTGASLMGIRGISLVAALFSFGYLLAVSAKSCVKDTSPLTARLLRGMLAAAFVTTTLIFIFESTERMFELYYVPVTALAFPLLAQEMDQLKDKLVSAGKKLLILLVCGCFLFQSAYSLYFIRVDKKHLDSWSGLAFREMQAVDHLQECIGFMQENGYTHALIDHWYAGTLAELTDGGLNVCPLQVDFDTAGIVTLGRWGTSEKAFLPENIPQTTIIFVQKVRSEAFAETFPDVPRLHEDWMFDGYAFPSEQIH